jgi:hypothetical protein
MAGAIYYLQILQKRWGKFGSEINNKLRPFRGCYPRLAFRALKNKIFK